MLILAKSILGLMIGFFLSVLFGLFYVPAMKKLKCGQTVSRMITERHLQKDGTPTLGGAIFIIPTIVAILLLWIKGSIEINHPLLIVLFVFISYALLGLWDDLKKILKHNNKGVSIRTKLIIQVLIALVFFCIYRLGGGQPIVKISILHLEVNLHYAYGLFILFLLVGTTNGVNVTDGEDGLAGGLCVIAFLCYGIISWGSYWITGYQEIAIFCFILTGSLLGFLVYNSHPAKIFMGDTGALGLGGALAAVAILTKHELSLAVIGGVFVIEALSSMIQRYSIKKFHKKVFLMAPIHHHFEKLGWEETDIVKLFWIVGFLLGMGAIYYGVWL